MRGLQSRIQTSDFLREAERATSRPALPVLHYGRRPSCSDGVCSFAPPGLTPAGLLAESSQSFQQRVGVRIAYPRVLPRVVPRLPRGDFATPPCAERTRCPACLNASQTTHPSSLFSQSLTPSCIVYYKHFSIVYPTETRVQRELSVAEVLESALEVLYSRIWDNLRCTEFTLNSQEEKLLVSAS